MENPVKVFSAADVKVALGIHEVSTHQEIFNLFNQTEEKRQNDLKNGFTVLLGNDQDGLSATYNMGADGTKFNVVKTTINGKNIHEKITGKYDIDGHNVDVIVDRETGNPMISASVFLDESLISSRSSPFDLAAQQADAFLLNVVQGQEGDASRLQKAIESENSPYPFAKKMLRDFIVSTSDIETINQMHKKLSSKDKIIWNR